jgi:hypothetical protein
MPLPPAPPREWRPIVDRCLAGFNGLALVAAFFLPTTTGAHDLRSLLAPLWFAPVPLAAIIGFLGRVPLRLRAILTLPSAIAWLLVAALIFPGILIQHAYAHRQHPPIPTPWTGPVIMALVFFAAAVLTVESAVARLRRR